VYLSSIHCVNFRNFKEITVEVPLEGAIFQGLNATGKTNFLEAIHVLCLGNSQRMAKRSEMIRSDSDTCYIEGSFLDSNNSRIHASIGFSRNGAVSMSFNGHKVDSIREWFCHGTVVSVCSDDCSLIYGPPSERRRFLDMVISQIDKQYLKQLVIYQRACANRNRLLQVRRDDDSLIDLYEERMVECGAYLYEKRAEFIAFCQDIFSDLHGQIGGENEHGRMFFRPSVFCDKTGIKSWKELYYNILKNKRKRDVALGYSSFGPHRDNIDFFVNEKPAKAFASKGQCRTLALSLRLCSLQCIRQHGGGRLILMVDDAFTELDNQRIIRVCSLIKGKGQLFLAAPTENIPASVEGVRFTISNGTVTRT